MPDSHCIEPSLSHKKVLGNSGLVIKPVKLKQKRLLSQSTNTHTHTPNKRVFMCVVCVCLTSYISLLHIDYFCNYFLKMLYYF